MIEAGTTAGDAGAPPGTPPYGRPLCPGAEDGGLRRHAAVLAIGVSRAILGGNPNSTLAACVMASEWPYEIVVYNRAVRARVEKGFHHRNLADSWAEVQHIDLTAKDAADARRKATIRFPESEGYVIDEIVELKSY